MPDDVARVTMELALDREFDYRVPSALLDRVRIGAVVRVPFGHSVRRGYVVGLRDHSTFPHLKEIESVEPGKPLLAPSLIRLARWISDYYAAPFEHAIRTLLPGAVRRTGAKHRQQLSVQILPAGAHPSVIKELRKKAPAQARILEYLIQNDQGFIQAVAEAAETTASVCRALEKKGMVRIGMENKQRDPLAGQRFMRTEPHVLNAEQQAALDVIIQAYETRSPSVVLLQGVTGSGKTEIYMQAMQHALDRGRGSIMLVPEIALTPQMMERFRGRFGDQVGVLHSHLSDGERHDEWHRIHRGKARIVLGARSALFAPVENLGLILVDEEHEHTYKQEESPRYQARDVAVMRGHFEPCAVVLGSATPSMESMHNAQIGKYALCLLRERVDQQLLPTIRVCDLRKEMDGEGRASFIGTDLKLAIGQRLERREQVILFLNRRGFSPSVVCKSCGAVADCDSCSVAMTYHRQTHQLICHMCGLRKAPPRACWAPGCGSQQIQRLGMGTQRLEDVIQRLFPRAVIARMDADSTTRKDAYSRIFTDFRSGKIDLLIGTQMIAKGLHFPNVTLVGVISADTALHLPDFRAAERTFQLLVQVAGRAGRGQLPGEVIIQTRSPENPVIKMACNGDYDAFVKRELGFRKTLGYPPFRHAVHFVLRSRNEDLAAYAAEQLAKQLSRDLGDYCTVSQSAPAHLAKIKEYYRYHLLIRTGSMKRLSVYLKELNRKQPFSEEVQLTVDVDALSLL